MHLQKFADKTKKIAGTKEKIAKGTTIGYVGTTGCSDGTTKHGAYGAHLHIELRDGGTGKGKILSPACASADALCDGNIPVPEAPVIENDPDPQIKHVWYNFVPTSSQHSHHRYLPVLSDR